VPGFVALPSTREVPPYREVKLAGEEAARREEEGEVRARGPLGEVRMAEREPDRLRASPVLTPSQGPGVMADRRPPPYKLRLEVPVKARAGEAREREVPPQAEMEPAGAFKSMFPAAEAMETSPSLARLRLAEPYREADTGEAMKA
jgi:hypothetical protein